VDVASLERPEGRKGPENMPRFNVDFSDEATAVLDELATKQGATKSDIIRKAIALQRWFEETREAGAKVLVELPDGRLREIVPL
jgi:predicted transcriptional regulator